MWGIIGAVLDSSLTRATRVLIATACLFIVLFSAGVVSAQGKSVVDATPEEEASARKVFIAAKQHYDAGNLAEALQGFRASYAIVASPNSHLMVARVLDELGRPAEAYENMRATMHEAEAVSRVSAELAGKYQRTLQTATALTAKLRQKVGFVTVELSGGDGLPQGSTLTVGGRQIEDITVSLVVDPGRVDISLQTPGGVRQITTEVVAGGEARVKLDVPHAAPQALPPPLPPDEGGGVTVMGALGYTSAAVGGAGMILFGVLGGLTLSAFNDLEDSCPNDVCAADKQQDIDDAKGLQIGANVSAVIGATGLVAAVALLLVDNATGGDSDSAMLIRTPNGVAIGGRF